MRKRFRKPLIVLIASAALGAACTPNAPSSRRTNYTPQARAITVTTVPLLVKEQSGVLPFLKEDFAKGGVLDGKEVYAFSPSTITVIEGDTIDFTFINAEDDVHSFILPDFAVSLPGQKTTTATYVARRAGIYTFQCAVQSHLPMMWGQLVVLAPSAVTPAGPTATAAPSR
ncbi:MAG TPA: cupredoxin domain-containing protein [Gemmatimonadaceae bacterium]|nr:cupredoxin domain-containing protein [Gemmatimonadaceae bacterium]